MTGSLDDQMKNTEERFREAAEAKGHYLKRDPDDGEVDFLAYSPDGHNGPVCEGCHDCWCIWCWKGDPETISPCSSPVIDIKCEEVK